MAPCYTMREGRVRNLNFCRKAGEGLGSTTTAAVAEGVHGVRVARGGGVCKRTRYKRRPPRTESSSGIDLLADRFPRLTPWAENRGGLRARIGEAEREVAGARRCVGCCRTTRLARDLRGAAVQRGWRETLRGGAAVQCGWREICVRVLPYNRFQAKGGGSWSVMPCLRRSEANSSLKERLRWCSSWPWM